MRYKPFSVDTGVVCEYFSVDRSIRVAREKIVGVLTKSPSDA